MASDAVWQNTGNWEQGTSLNESSEARPRDMAAESYGEFGKRVRGMNGWIKREREKGDWPRVSCSESWYRAPSLSVLHGCHSLLAFRKALCPSHVTTFYMQTAHDTV